MLVTTSTDLPDRGGVGVGEDVDRAPQVGPPPMQAVEPQRVVGERAAPLGLTGLLVDLHPLAGSVLEIRVHAGAGLPGVRGGDRGEVEVERVRLRGRPRPRRSSAAPPSHGSIAAPRALGRSVIAPAAIATEVAASAGQRQRRQPRSRASVSTRRTSTRTGEPDRGPGRARGARRSQVGTARRSTGRASSPRAAAARISSTDLPTNGRTPWSASYRLAQ